MPFTLRPLDVQSRGDETIVRGRLLTGAYFGPEALLLRAADGRECHSHVHSQAMEFPQDWPILPEHEKTIISMWLPLLPAGFTPSLVTGLGAVETAANRLDISHVLSSPAFWASHASLHLTSDELEEPNLALFGLSTDAVNAWFEANIDRHQSEGRWPYVRVPLPHSRYIEMEFAAGTEYQDRIWIGHLSGTHRVLLGYHSAHFSLPALRVSEALWLAEQTNFEPAALLWLSSTYLGVGSYPLDCVEHLVSRLPGLLPGQAKNAALAHLAPLNVADVRWTPDANHGWINDGAYSQRNPLSRLSILTSNDFAFIRTFFP